jgi:pilus assembly protein TadC
VCPDPRRSWSLGRRRVAGAGRRTPSDSEVSSALALLALAYRSGLPTWDVLDAVADGLGGPVAADLQQVANALRWGATESEAWGSVGRAWAPAARAVAIAHQAGVPPGSMLLAAGDDLRSAELERLEVSAAKVGVRLVAPLGLVLLPAFCLTTVAPLVIALARGLLRP